MKYLLPLTIALLLTACSPAPRDLAMADEQSDPFEMRDAIKPFNEAVFAFNLKADRYAVKPVADLYHHVPDIARDGVSNVLSNLKEPANFVNGVLQGKPQVALTAFWRFTLNTTFGIFGLRDFASENGLKSRDTKFGETLGVYGVSTGSYVVLPLFGPSTTRDTAGKVVDWFLDPLNWYMTTPQSIAQGVSEGITTRDRNAAIIDQLYYESLEPYSATRAAYLQHEAFQ
jgi:phospholipid-binding lipoprotein MlaA